MAAAWDELEDRLESLSELLDDIEARIDNGYIFHALSIEISDFQRRER